MSCESNETVLKVDGMTCAHCVKHVSEALRAVPGVRDVEVQLEAGRARVRHDGASIASLLAAVEDAGYAAGEA